MAAQGGSFLTALEIAKREDPKGMIGQMAELLHESNPMLDDIPMVQANHGLSNRTTQRIGLPAVSKRRYNKGIAPTRSSADQIVDTIASFETHAHTDTKLLKHAPDKMAVRLQENQAHIEAIGQSVAYDLFYGDSMDDPEEFNGFATRYDDTNGAAANSILSAGGSSDLTSIWLIGWAPDKVCGIYPEHGIAGLQTEDLGVRYIQDATGPAGAALPMYVDVFSWDVGLAVKNWQYVVRICNIDLGQALDVQTPHLLTESTNPLKLMSRAIHRLPNTKACRPVFYMNRTMMEALDVQHMDATLSNVFRTQDAQGRVVDTYRGIPIHVTDALKVNETAVDTTPDVVS